MQVNVAETDLKETENNSYDNIKWDKIQNKPSTYDLKRFNDAIDKESYAYYYLKTKNMSIAQKIAVIAGVVVGKIAGLITGTVSSIASLYLRFGVTDSPLKTKYNIMVDEHSKIVKTLKVAVKEWKILTKKCMAEETAFKNKDFTFERWDTNRKVILMIGPTGFGKSTVCNRLMGNNDDIDEISESESSPFKVANAGEVDPETTSLNKKSWNVKIYKDDNNKNILGSYDLSIVDSPGAFCSKGYDKAVFNDTMKKYFNACGGINLFCIFFRYGNKWDTTYDTLLKDYQTFWGKNMWKHCCVIITNCDKDGKNAKGLAKGLPKTKNEIKKSLNKISKNRCNHVKMYEFGEDNFKESRQEILLSLLNHNKKYMNEQVSAEINELWDNQKKQQKKCEESTRKANTIKDKLDACERECINAES